jgi:hypothetical protein
MAVLTFLDRDKSFARPGYSRRLVPPAALFLGSSPTGRYAAAICFLLGSLLTRYAWIWRAPLRPMTLTRCSPSSARTKGKFRRRSEGYQGESP